MIYSWAPCEAMSIRGVFLADFSFYSCRSSKDFCCAFRLNCTLGASAPEWVPDDEWRVCMQCENHFTLIKRRHHCRACGRVLCSDCCNMRAKLTYMDGKTARVCQQCASILKHGKGSYFVFDILLFLVISESNELSIQVRDDVCMLFHLEERTRLRPLLTYLPF
ncbi:FYVE domain containing protein [Trichuris trichiura]|uniref:FYVE domain containing protein n=1 Tax=Trichuris trichiura TaxID=36087 RepID=A0A077YVV0_TRITR|nr:FYVE domain containing protein [Trichuris trichiura]